MGSGGVEETGPLIGLPAVGFLGAGASVDAPPSSPRNPRPFDLAMESKFRGWSSLEDWNNYFTITEEKLEQNKRQLEEEGRADWAELTEIKDENRRFEKYLDEAWSRLKEETEQLMLEIRQTEKKREEDRARWDRIEADLQLRSEEVERQERDLNIQEEALNKFLAMKREQLQKPLLVQSDRHKNKDHLQKPLLLQPEHERNKGWNLIDIVSVLAFATALILFLQIQTSFSFDYPKFFVDAFATLWALGTVLSFRISRRSRRNSTASHYIAPFASLFLTLLGLYVLYVISGWVDGTCISRSLLHHHLHQLPTLVSRGRDAVFSVYLYVIEAWA